MSTYTPWKDKKLYEATRVAVQKKLREAQAEIREVREQWAQEIRELWDKREAPRRRGRGAGGGR